MQAMLGRLRRTSRTDVGLALSFAGVAYLVWVLVAGVSRNLVQEFINSPAVTGGQQLPDLTRMMKVFFVDAGFVIDLAGLAWLVASLLLVGFSSRQRIGISWAWVSAVGQVMIAALGSVLVGWATFAPYMAPAEADGRGRTPLETVSTISLPIIVSMALLIWVTCLVWLLIERARFDRHGPTLHDGLRTNIR